MSLSIECKGDSLGWLPDAHGVKEHLQWSEVPVLDEFYRSLVLKMPVRGVEKDAGMGLVAGVEVHKRHPNPVDAAQFALQAAGVGMLADSWGLASDGLCDHTDWNVQLVGNPRCVEAARLRVEKRRIGRQKCMCCGHGTPLLGIIKDRKCSVKVSLLYRIGAPASSE